MGRLMGLKKICVRWLIRWYFMQVFLGFSACFLLLYSRNLLSMKPGITVQEIESRNSNGSISSNEVLTVKKLIEMLATKTISTENRTLWHIVPGSTGPKKTNKNTLVAAHSAYWQPLGEHIVIIVVSDAPSLIKKNAWNFTFSCAFYDNQNNFLGNSSANFTTRDLVHCFLPRTASSRVFRPINFESVPDHVILYRNDSNFAPKSEKPHWLLPIQNNYKRLISNDGKVDGTFAICVKILYGDPQWLLMVQFFEYYKTQNVSKFFIKVRTKDMKPHIQSILRFYEAQNLVEILPWDLEYKFCPKPDKWCQLTQINECVFRTAYRYRYVAVIDYDELIVSANQSLSLIELVQSLDRKERGSITFAAKYFTTNKTDLSWENARKILKADVSTSLKLSDHLPLTAWNNISEKVVSSVYSPKTIVKPETIKRMWVHFARSHYHGFGGYTADTKKEGYFLHFKNSSKWPQMKQTYKWSNYTIADVRKSSLSNLIYTVSSNVEKALKEILNL